MPRSDKGRLRLTQRLVVLATAQVLLSVSALYGQSASDSVAEDTAVLSLSKRLARLNAFDAPPPPVMLPGVTASTPSAFGLSARFVGMGIGIRQYTRLPVHIDGAVGIMAGVGDLGVASLDLGIAILDLRSREGEGGFGQRGAFMAKIHGRINRETAVALGIENVLNWGEGTDTPVSTYVVMTRKLRQGEDGTGFGTAFITAGLGYGRFALESAVREGKSGMGAFGSASFSLSASLSTFAEWTGQDLGVGVSLVPLRSVPLVITSSMVDPASENARVVLSVGTAFAL